jgi:hypothetical protein
MDMSVDAVGQASSALSGANLANAVNISLLKKTQDLAAQQMSQLLGTIPGLGDTVDYNA